jgi:AcrR family transcriptional regulator
MRGQSDVERPSEHVLAVAARLFYNEGANNVGIDRIQKESGAARATIYRHYPNKEALVTAFIIQRDEQYRAWLRERTEALAPNPTNRPLAVFTAIQERVNAKGFRGCAFTNTIAEFPDPNHPAHAAARLHKKRVVDYLTEVCDRASIPKPNLIAAQLMVLVDGAIVGSIRDGNDVPLHAAISAAKAILAPYN